MKVTWDPSLLLWTEESLANHAYLQLSAAALYHLHQLEDISVPLIMPTDWPEIFQHFPFGDRRFHPEAMELSSIFWGFMGNNADRVEEIPPLAEIVALQPEICPSCLPEPQKLVVKGFFGRIASIKEEGNHVSVLSSTPARYEPVGGHLNVLMVSRACVVRLDVVFDDGGWECIEERLDYGPDAFKCVKMRARHLSKTVIGAAARQFTFTPALEEYLTDLWGEDSDLFEEIVDAMARWVAGVPTGLKPHKLEANKWRLDVRKGDGNKVHCRFGNSGIEFFEYHDDHDRYKID